MKYFSLLLLALLTCQLSFGQTYSTIVTDNEIYSFLNWYNKKMTKSENLFVRSKVVVNYIIPWYSSNFNADNYSAFYPDNYIFDEFEGSDNIFTEENKQYLLEQYAAIKDSIWHSKFKGTKLIDKKEKNRYKGYYSFSVPLFFENKKFVIVKVEYYCGTECGYGGYYIFRCDKKDRWELLKIISPWIS